MRAYAPGETAPFCLFNWRDNDGNAIDQAAFDANGGAVAIRLLDTAYAQVVAPVTASLEDLNDWCASLTMPTTVGSYLLEVATTYDGLAETQYEDVLVRRAGSVGPGVTLAQLRRRVADELGDILYVTVTTDAADGNTFTDETAFRKPDGYFESATAYASGGTAANLGVERIVQSNALATKSVTVQPAFPATIREGDEFELHNERGTGWSAKEKHRAINAAIQDAAALGGVEVSVELAAAFDAGTPSMVVPDTVSAIALVEYQGTDDGWYAIPRASRPGAAGWSIHRGLGTLEVHGSWKWSADGRGIRLRGYGMHEELTEDDDTTLVNPTYVVNAACYRLCRNGLDRDTSRERLIGVWKFEADKWLPAASRTRGPSTVQVR